MEDQSSLRIREAAAAANKDEPTPMNTSPTSPTKDESKVKNWLKTRFSRRSSKAQKPGPEEPSSSNGNRSSFIGGAALTGASANNSTASLGQKSERVTSPLASPALPTQTEENPIAKVVEPEPEEESARGRTDKRRDSDVSALSEADPEEFQEARDEFDEDLAPPPTFVAGKSSSPARETKFTEAI
jgi:hypothetical protein